ncbi:hypothetical protein AURDEDRAFT_63162 [Auricularia subglabra TFB-10046 SS5]|nr:hypothetical protein AURDEDRAFT_63162 [Auricularia subglabra TFB-10046 SS5]
MGSRSFLRARQGHGRRIPRERSDDQLNLARVVRFSIDVNDAKCDAEWIAQAAGGRRWEGFGANLYLSGIATAETARGIQDQGVISCVKHLCQEHFRGGSLSEACSSNIDDRTMHEVYVCHHNFEHDLLRSDSM